MKIRAWITPALFLGLTLVFVWGCGGMKDLRMENEQLRAEIDQLRRIENDYGEQIRNAERLTESEKARLRSEMEGMRARLNANLQDQIAQNDALVEKVKDLTVIEIGEAALFSSGQAALSPGGNKVVRRMAEVFKRYPGYQVRVEGHTDSVPIGKNLKPQFPSNWELSTARATNVVRTMIDQVRLDPARLQAVGYAQYRPAASNDTAQGRAKNRRIRIVVFKSMQVQPAE